MGQIENGTKREWRTIITHYFNHLAMQYTWDRIVRGAAVIGFRCYLVFTIRVRNPKSGTVKPVQPRVYAHCNYEACSMVVFLNKLKKNHFHLIS